MRSRSVAALAALALCALALSGCGGAAGSSPATSATPTIEASGPDPITEWCGVYSTMTRMLAQAGTTQAEATQTLTVLTKFGELWSVASKWDLVSPSEAAANQRAIGAYAKVIILIQGGAAEGSSEVAQAKAALTARTQEDHDLLQSSAGKVLGLCGPASAAPSPSTS